MSDQIDPNVYFAIKENQSVIFSRLKSWSKILNIHILNNNSRQIIYYNKHRKDSKYAPKMMIQSAFHTGTT